MNYNEINQLALLSILDTMQILEFGVLLYIRDNWKVLQSDQCRNS